MPKSRSASSIKMPEISPVRSWYPFNPSLNVAHPDQTGWFTPRDEINALVPIWPIGVSKWNFDIKQKNRWIHIGSCNFRQFVMLIRLCQNCVLTLHALALDEFGTWPPRFIFKHCIFTVNVHKSYGMFIPSRPPPDGRRRADGQTAWLFLNTHDSYLNTECIFTLKLYTAKSEISNTIAFQAWRGR